MESRTQGGAGNRGPYLAVPLQPLQGCGWWAAPRGPPFGARGPRCPRRNHGFARRLPSGAGAEAILSEAPVSAAVRGGGNTGHPSRACPRARKAPDRDPRPAPPTPRRPGLEATPPSPRPPRIRLRSDTRSPRPTPGHVSSSRAGRSLSTKQRGLGRSRSPPGPDRARPTAGPRAEAAVTKRLLCRPARPRCGGRNRPRPPRKPRRTAPEAPGSSRSRKPRLPVANPWPHRNPQHQPPHCRPPPAGHRAAGQSPPAWDPPELRVGTAGS